MPVTHSTEIASRLPSIVYPGDKILFRAEKIGQGISSSRIYTSDLSGNNLVNLSGENTDWFPTISIDGQWIALVSDRTGNPEIYTMNAYRSSIEQISNNIGDDEDPVLSPDGNSLAFSSNRGAGQFDIYIVPIKLPQTIEKLIISK